MFGDFLLLEDGASSPGCGARAAARLPLGETGGRDEAWLRDTLFHHPEILPLGDLDPSFGPLIPLCRELRTEAGPLDIAYINTRGQLTLVECKLWRNPEARRKVVAQVLDYARAISRWSYADLQRQVSAALGEKGDVPFARALAADPSLSEHGFIDAVSRSLRAGRFLLLIAGDGIREDIGAMAELINRNAASGFSFGLVEVALYDLGQGGVAVQPRVLTRTQTIERHVMILRSEDGAALAIAPGAIDGTDAPPASTDQEGADNPQLAAYRAWWAPVINTPLDDPEQEQARLYWLNNIRARLPWPGTGVTVYVLGKGSGQTLGVFLAGTPEARTQFWAAAAGEVEDIISELPPGTTLVLEKDAPLLKTVCSSADFPDEAARQAWAASALNAYINALRPRMKRLAPR